MLTQELRQTVKEINNPPPQLEDPERSLDPDSQEDPDLCVELIDGVSHQLSKDNTLVAITADYPGLLPASKVTETEVPSIFKRIHPCLFLIAVYQWHFSQGKSLRRRAEPAVASQQGPSRPSRLKRSADRIETPVQWYGMQF